MPECDDCYNILICSYGVVARLPIGYIMSMSNYGAFHADKFDRMSFPGEVSDVEYDRKGNGFVVVGGRRIIVEDAARIEYEWED